MEGVAAVILAGGQGSRIRHLLQDVPKPLAKVAGKPFLAWLIRLLNRQGVEEFVISSGYLGEKIEEFAATLDGSGIKVSVASETTPLGTGGGFLNAVTRLSADVHLILACNGDSLLLSNLTPVFDALEDRTVDAAIAGVQVENAGRFGTISMTPEGLMSAFREKQPGAGLINAGLYLFRRDLIRRFPAVRPLSFEVDVFPSLLQQGARIKVVALTGPFLDIGTEPTLSQATGFIQSNQEWFL
jgi:NDP-sugar pyrophosphorylase family protein